MIQSMQWVGGFLTKKQNYPLQRYRGGDSLIIAEEERSSDVNVGDQIFQNWLFPF
jgi:hypothetical protein